MLSKLKNLMRRNGDMASVMPTRPVRMSLDERKAYRRELLYQTVREGLLNMEVLSSMYKFKVMNLDERQHRFVAMIDVTSLFQAKKGGMNLGFFQIEEQLRASVFERTGVSLDAVFWRVNENKESFARQGRSGDTPNTNAASQRKPETPGDLREARVRLARSNFDPVTPEERHAFQTAVQAGARPPVLHVGDLEYQSDLAPLESKGDIGGTQYGQL